MNPQVCFGKKESDNVQNLISIRSMGGKVAGLYEAIGNLSSSKIWCSTEEVVGKSSQRQRGIPSCAVASRDLMLSLLRRNTG